MKLASPSVSQKKVRHHDQDEREADGAMHGNDILPVLKGRFRKQLEKEFTDEDWLHCLYLGRFKTRFEICKDANGELRYTRAIQEHSGGMIISPRLMNYVMILYRWKQFIYHVGRARDQYSIAEADWWQEEKNVKKEGNQSSSLLLILSTAMGNQGKYIVKFIGDLNKMQCTGFICPQHKMLVWTF